VPKLRKLKGMKCDKCGQEVPWENDATIVESFYQDSPGFILLYGARHFLPTEDCKGSPSRAQYIEGQPRDTREAYPYNPMRERRWRHAYALTLKGKDRAHNLDS
jgi:hypothetical protein